MTAADTVRLHWPTRDRYESRVVLSRIFWRWHLRVGLTYRSQHELLQRILKHPVELAEFDATLRECCD